MGIREAPEILKKTPVEVVVRPFEFSGAGLATGETLSTIVSATVDPVEGSGLAIDASVIAGSQVQLTLSGGVLYHSYEVEVLVTTSTGETLETCGTMVVLPC